MISIVVCEDQEEERGRLVRDINACITMEEMDFCIVGAYRRAEDLIEDLPKIQKPCVYFLDVDLGGGQEGFDAAAQIRQEDPSAVIAFITSHKELMGDVFRMQLETMDYINKDAAMPERVRLVLKRAQRKYSYCGYNWNDTVAFHFGQTVFFLGRDEIIAVRTANESRKLEIDTWNGSRQCSGQLKDVAAMLGEGFLKCERGCIVNRKHIRGYDRKEGALIMENGKRYYVSERKRKRFYEEFLKTCQH